MRPTPWRARSSVPLDGECRVRVVQRDSSGGRMRTPTVLLVAVLIPVCYVTGQSANRTCPPRDTVYALAPADSGRDFKVASPAVIQTPPPEFHGGADVHMLIAADGRVVGIARGSWEHLPRRTPRSWPGQCGPISFIRPPYADAASLHGMQRRFGVTKMANRRTGPGAARLTRD